MDELEKRLNELQGDIDSLENQLAEGYFQIIKLLSRVTEMSEKYYDGSHSRFVAEKSAQVAREMGMSSEEVMEVRIAGLIHDIGKLNFPDTCLYKFSNEMNENEYSKYQTHPELGMHILEPYELLSNIGHIVLQHHEKLDGSGYPKQITRDQIHPAAKIIIVVDYFHNQIFKRARQRGENFVGSIQFSSTATFLDSTRERYNSALNFLTKKANVLYDAKIVDTFIKLMEFDRRLLGTKSVLRVSANGLEPGYVFAEDYFTNYGLLIAAKGETITNDTIFNVKKFIDANELPQKILVMK